MLRQRRPVCPLFAAGLLGASGFLGLSACGDEGGLAMTDPVSPTKQPIIFGEAACAAAHQQSSGALLFEGTMQFQLGEVSGRTVLCSAVLVAPDVALTAAHCVDLRAIGATAVQTTTRAISFAADLRDVYDNGAPLPVDAIAVVDDDVAPDFDPDAFRGASGGLGAQQDWALLYLERAVDPDVATPVSVLSDVDAALRVGDAVDVVGHGTADPAGATPGDGTTGQRLCGTSFVNLLGDDEVQIGSGSQTLRRCEVDSGGPTFVTRQGERVLASIGSRAFAAQGEQACGQGAIDTRVDVLVDALDATMRAACDTGRRRDCTEPGLRTTPPPGDDAGISDVDAGPDDPHAGVEDVDAGSDGGIGDGLDGGVDGPTDVVDSGCACAGEGRTSDGVLGALFLLLVRRRRRA